MSGRRHHRNPPVRSAHRAKSTPEGIRRLLPLAAIIGLILVGASGLRSFLVTRASHPIGGPYALVDTVGRPVTQASFSGRYTLIYFGYTHCIDVCPLTLETVAHALDALGPAAQKIIPVFITVDPSRDTPAVVGDYVRHFSGSIVGLTGSTQQIDRVVDEFHVSVRRRPVSMGQMPDDYLMDHSSVLYLMDGDNRLVSVLPVDTSPTEIASRLRRLVAAG